MLTAKVRDTVVAAAYVAFPDWLASIVQSPADTSVRVVPDTVQTAAVVDAKLTARPEVALADSAAGVTPNVCAPGDVKLMLCAVGAGAGAGAGAGEGDGEGEGEALPPPQPEVAAAAATNKAIRPRRGVEMLMGVVSRVVGSVVTLPGLMISFTVKALSLQGELNSMALAGQDMG